MKLTTLAAAALFGFTPAMAAELSTHVLDLAQGIGGRDIPVVLSKKSGSGGWSEVAKARTGENGRVGSFGDPKGFGEGTYKLQFDMSGYPAGKAAPFFPEIDVVFQVSDAGAHYHVPVVVSPFGYSTYRGN